MKYLRDKIRNMKILGKTLTVLILCVAIALSAISVLAVADMFVKNKKYRNTYERILARDGFIYGSVMHQYGGKNIFGARRVAPKDKQALPGYDEAVMRDVLQNHKAMGLNSISFWLFTNYAGIEIDEVGNILGLDEYFEKNLRAVLKLCREYDVTASLATYVHPGEMMAQDGITNYYMERIMQPIVNPEIRQQYVEKVLYPVADIVKEYEDIVIMMDVFAEPESTIDGSNGYAFSTDWETTYDFIKASVQAFKKKLPDMPVTCASGWGSNLSLYNNLGLDIIGADVYNNDGSVYDPSEQITDAPVIAREYGISSNIGRDEELQLAHATKFLDNAIKAGYVGAYFYQFNGWNTETWSLTKSYTNVNDLRPLCAPLSYYIADKIAKHRGIETSDDSVAEAPHILGLDNPFMVQWIAARNADKYTIEGSKDNKNWTVLAKDLLPEDVDEDGDNMCRYRLSEVAQGTGYYYRIKVVNYNGKETYSAARKYNIPLITCSDQENLLKNYSFETGDLSEWRTDDNDAFFPVEESDGGTYGTKAVHITPAGGRWPYFYQSVNVKPNTDYVATIIYRCDNSQASVVQKSHWKIRNGNPHTGGVTGEIHFNYSETDWLIDNITVNTGDRDSVSVFFTAGDSVAYIDAVFFFEKK